MKVLLVTTWGTACGIAEHSAYLKEAVEAADPSIEIIPSAEALDPDLVTKWSMDGTDRLIHLNYHAALHSRWTPEQIRRMQAGNRKVLVTFHDTGVPNADQCKAVINAADAAVVHEPFDDLPAEKVRYWRMGVPTPTGRVGEHTRHTYTRPMLGTVGHDFPWKCWEQVAETAAAAGWGFLICTPAMTDEHERALHALNPWLTVRRGLNQATVLADLHECDATAFLFSCCNSGQSASILMGVSVGKPVLAFSHCRQMRALFMDGLGSLAIRWCESFDEARNTLEGMTLGRFDPPTIALAAQDSWVGLGQRYAGLYRSLAGV